jgi:hypothetical protein
MCGAAALCDREGGGLGASERAKGDCLAVEYKTSGPIEGLKGGLKWCCCCYCKTGAACCVKQGCRRAVFWFGMVLRVLSAPLSLSLSPDQGTVRHGDCIDLKITGYRNTYLDT